MLLVSSTMLLAKEDRPAKRIEITNQKVETVLVAKKTLKDQKVQIDLVGKKSMNLEGCLAIAFTVISVDPPLGSAMTASCLETYSK